MQKGTKTKTDHNSLLFLPKQMQDGGYFQMVGQMISDFDSQCALGSFVVSVNKYVP